MKKFLPLLYSLLLFQYSNGQITTPIVKANFGVDAEPAANFFNGAPQPAFDDWFSNGNVGTGQFVIDTTGAAAIVAGYNTNPASRKLSFARTMRQAPYTTVNNRLLLDAIFHRDFHGMDSTVFASGSNKNAMSPASWNCPTAQGIPDKNDILDAFTHVRRGGPNVTDSMWMFSAISLENTNGSRYFDFELYQTDIYFDRTALAFRNYGPDAGHTSWQFDAMGRVSRAGDIIFTAEFSSASLTLVEARIWIDRASLSMVPFNFNWGTQFDGASAGATYGYASIRPKTAGAFYTGVPCVANTWAGPFSLVREDNSVVTTYIANQFLEFSVNLTKLGLDPGQTMNNPCGSAFRRVLVKSRASNSFTAELKDFIAPYRMFNYPVVDANTFIVFHCGTFPPTTISVQNAMAPSVYTWSTPNGSIVGSNVGTSIVVNAPGTYYVSQQLHVQCPFYSRDSVVMLFEPVCAVLDIDIIDFKANRVDRNVDLKWTATNNKDAASYTVEYSFDNRDFVAIANLPSNAVVGNASYSFRYPLTMADKPVIYYRIKVTARNSQTKYSKTIVLLTAGSAGPAATVFPNPTVGDVWVAFQGKEKEVGTLSIWDSNGKMLTSRSMTFARSENLFQINDLVGQPRGVYILKITTANTTITAKVILIEN